MHSESKNEVFRLTKTNNLLTEEITYYKAGNAQLSFKIKEIFNFSVDSKVKWLDSSGETEYGIVCDDFFSDNKHFVVVRGINKKGKVTGRYFTVSAHKISID